MGEKIAKLNMITIKGVPYEIELNHPVTGATERQIHIQSSICRIEMVDNEFYQFYSAVKLASEKLRRLKKLE